MHYRICTMDPLLEPFAQDIALRMANYRQKRAALLGNCHRRLSDFANGYQYFGFHPVEDGWVYREWAPAAEAMYLTGDFNGWDSRACPMDDLGNGVFQVTLTGEAAPQAGQRLQAVVIHDGTELRRIPTYATRVVQDPADWSWCAQLEDTLAPFPWTDSGFRPEKPLLIYECHIGMAQENCQVGSYRAFTEQILPRIKALGYNTIQLMAIMEHPYYASFGYQVTNFFAASSRYGHSQELKALIDTAHSMGIAVLLDVVHSHAAKNTAEGLAAFDGTSYQFFHDGPQGDHGLWGTKCFHYGKTEVLHFLLSNLKYWMEVFHFDGFRFDGVTSMLYRDHGLGRSFSSYEAYFSPNTDPDAVTYLQLANELIHQLSPHAVTIAEDMSGMPGMCLKLRDGGIGFDYRLSMGAPDMWIKNLRDLPDEQWHVGRIWGELADRRPGEKVIGYCECHDQALVGEKTIMFRLCDAHMYTAMEKGSGDLMIDRGMALHKLIRLVTATLAGEGWLNFMGNEFGHPEWIDFPREGNGWSHHYCRRQWSLVDDPHLRYGELRDFDSAMLTLLRKEQLLTRSPRHLFDNVDDHVLLYARGSVVFAFNFHPTRSFEGYFLYVPAPGTYRVILSTDDPQFGGPGRVDTNCLYQARKTSGGRFGFPIYLPSRSAIALKRVGKAR